MIKTAAIISGLVITTEDSQAEECYLITLESEGTQIKLRPIDVEEPCFEELFINLTDLLRALESLQVIGQKSLAPPEADEVKS